MSERTAVDKLTHAYNRMMERAKARFEELEQKEQELLPQFQHSIEHAAEKAVELGELSRQEAGLLTAWLKRDVTDAGKFLAGTGQGLRDWLRFDLDLVEDRLLDLFRHAADRTRLDMLQFQETLAETARYRTGEITGPGTLRCDHCGEMLVFHTTAAIPACPRCGGIGFHRVVADAVN